MGNYRKGKDWPNAGEIAATTWDPNFIGENRPGGFSWGTGDIEQEQQWSTDTWIRKGGANANFVRVDFVGLTLEKDGTYIWRHLWVKQSRDETGLEEDAVFYYARKRDVGWWQQNQFGTFKVDTLLFEQYHSDQDFKALRGPSIQDSDGTSFGAWRRGQFAEIEQDDPRQVDTWNSMREGGGSSGGSSSSRRHGGRGRNSASGRAGRNAAHGISLTTSANAHASRELFREAMGDVNRYQSKFESERQAMNAIQSRVVRTLPLSALTAGGVSSGHMGSSITRALDKAGYYPAQIEWFKNGGLTDPLMDGLGIFKMTGPREGSSAAGFIDPPPKITPPTPAVTTITVRAPVGYTKPAGRGADMRPHIQQVSTHLSEPDRYFFRNIPNTVSYQGLGSRWVEIPRKGDFPIVEWSDWALMKVSFDFLVAHEMDGLFHDVSEDLDQLRRMAQRPYPVSVFGMDQLFSLQMKRAQSTGRAMQFVIANFTVKSARRTVGEGDKEIAAAQCSMTLQEIPIEEMKVVEMSMPPLTGTPIPGKPGDGDTSSSPALPSDQVTELDPVIANLND